MISLLWCSRGASGCVLYSSSWTLQCQGPDLSSHCPYAWIHHCTGEMWSRAVAAITLWLLVWVFFLCSRFWSCKLVFGITQERQAFLSSPLPQAPSATCFVLFWPSPWLGLCWRFLLHPASYPSRPNNKNLILDVLCWKFLIRFPACFTIFYPLKRLIRCQC